MLPLLCGFFSSAVLEIWMGYRRTGTSEHGHEEHTGSAWGPESTGAYNTSGDSFAWNPNFEAEAIQFEANLGARAFEHGNAKSAAEACCMKAIEYMTARGNIADELGDLGHTMDDLLKECGGTETFIAGNVGKDPRDVEGVLKGGNLRERMTAWHHFVEHVFMEDMKAPSEQFAWLEMVMEDADIRLERIRTWRAANAGTIDDGNPDTQPDKWKNPMFVDESGSEPAEGRVNTLGSARAPRGAVTGDTNRTTSMTGATSPTQISQREAEHMSATTAGGDIDMNAELTWSEGMKSHIMNEYDPWVQMMREISVPLRAGPSGHTNVFMNGNQMLGVGNQPDDMRLACLGYLLPINAHSMIEVLQAARPYGASPYPEDRTVYTAIKPLTEDELRACGVDNRFPHEAPGAAANPNQQGRTSTAAGGSSALSGGSTSS